MVTFKSYSKKLESVLNLDLKQEKLCLCPLGSLWLLMSLQLL